MNENMRLQQENDTLAHEIVTTQVGTQEKITEVQCHFTHSSSSFTVFYLTYNAYILIECIFLLQDSTYLKSPKNNLKFKSLVTQIVSKLALNMLHDVTRKRIYFFSFYQLEEKVNRLLIENERTTSHLKEAEEEIERLKQEELRVRTIASLFSLVQPHIHAFIQSFILSVIHSFIKSFVYSFFRSFVRSLIN